MIDVNMVGWIYSILLSLLLLPLLRYVLVSGHIRQFGLLYTGIGLIALIWLTGNAAGGRLLLYAAAALAFVLWGICVLLPSEREPVKTALLLLGVAMAILSSIVFGLTLLLS
jgi:hypothetical protein